MLSDANSPKGEGQPGQTPRRFSPRIWTRYRLGVPAVFSWTDPKGKRRQAGGYSRDLSVGGAFLFTPACPQLGAPVRVDAFLPPLADMGSALRMQMRGRVVRVGAAGKSQEAGFAVASDQLVLRELRTPAERLGDA